VEHVIEIHTILPDGSRAIFGSVTPAEFFGQDARATGLEGRIYLIRRSAPCTTQRSARAIHRHCRRVCLATTWTSW